MSEAIMPQLWINDNNMAARRQTMWNGVEILVAIAPKEDRFGLEILNRKTRNIKFNRTIIVASKLSNR
jgi:hypothetical protein